MSNNVMINNCNYDNNNNRNNNSNNNNNDYCKLNVLTPIRTYKWYVPSSISDAFRVHIATALFIEKHYWTNLRPHYGRYSLQAKIILHSLSASVRVIIVTV